jgi:hypothetical protein
MDENTHKIHKILVILVLTMTMYRVIIFFFLFLYFVFKFYFIPFKFQNFFLNQNFIKTSTTKVSNKLEFISLFFSHF